MGCWPFRGIFRTSTFVAMRSDLIPNQKLSDLVASWFPNIPPNPSAPQSSMFLDRAPVLFLPPAVAGQPYLCATCMTQSPRGLLLTHQTLTSPTSIRFPSHLGITRPPSQGPLHAPSSSSTTSSKDPSFLQQAFRLSVAAREESGGEGGSKMGLHSFFRTRLPSRYNPPIDKTETHIKQ
jgi:hypothetical protein